MPNLITRERAKQAIPTATDADDDALDAQIAAASAAIARWLGRTLPASTHDEIYDGPGRGSLWLRQYPVTSVSRVAAALTPALAVRNDGAERATVASTTGGLTLTRVAGGATTTDASVVWSAYPTVAAVKDAVAALGAGWSAVVYGDFALWPAADVAPLQGPKDCKNRLADLALFADDLTDVIVDGRTGELRGCFPRGAGAVRVQYAAGYAVVPEDAQQACALLVARWFADRGRDRSLASERLGDYSYSAVGVEALPNDIRQMLASYRSLAS